MQNCTSATPMTFDANPILHGGVLPSGLEGSVSYPSLMGYEFSDRAEDVGDGAEATAVLTTAVVLNLSGKKLAYNNSGGDCISYVIYSSPGSTPAAWSSATTPIKAFHIDHAPESMVLQPYSIVVMHMR
jgi:hypothetical protein